MTMSIVKETCEVNHEFYENEYSFDELKEGALKIFNSSQEQFENIKKEKWFNRLYDMVTFSKKNEKNLARQISSLTQAQQILMEILVRLSERDNRITDLVRDSYETLKRLTEDDIRLAKNFKYLETKLILGLDKKTDIGELKDVDKELLAGFLFKLFEMYKPFNENQKRFFDTVLNYIEVKEPQNISLDKIQNINEIDVRTIIVRTGMELVFLKEEKADCFSTQEFESILEYFDLGKKSLGELINSIENLYACRGADGFYNRYGYVEYEDLSSEFYAEFEEIDEFKEDNEKTEFNISEIDVIKNDENIVVKNKVVRMTDTIYVNGSLEFEDCEIIFENDLLTICMTVENGSLTFTNTIVNMENSCEITAISLKNSAFTANNCQFNNCSKLCKLEKSVANIRECHFVGGNGTVFMNDNSYISDTTILFRDCQVIQHIGNFINISCSSNFISCSFAKNIKPNGEIDYYNIDYLLKVGSSTIEKCTFEGNDGENDIKIIENSQFETLLLTECTFKTIQSKQDATSFESIASLNGNVKIQHCNFYKTSGLDLYFGKFDIINCKFEYCEGTIIHADLSESIRIENCQFKYCKNTTNNGSIVSGKSIIAFPLITTSSHAIDIKNCTFDNCHTSGENNWYKNSIIFIRGKQCKHHNTASIENCIFNECTVENGKILDCSEVQEIKPFLPVVLKGVKTKTYEYAYVRNCKGI